MYEIWYEDFFFKNTTQSFLISKIMFLSYFYVLLLVSCIFLLIKITQPQFDWDLFEYTMKKHELSVFAN